MGVTRTYLDGLYVDTDDPWGFRTVASERERFAATAAALPRRRYASALEVGCGNGELARELALRCDAYAGLDAVPRAVEAAQRAVPRGRFVQGFLPCDLPEGDHDVVVLSEVLYFLDVPAIAAVAAQVDRRWAGADVVVVSYLGPTGHALDGRGALAAYADATTRTRRPAPGGEGFRIDVFHPLTGRAS